MKNDDFTVEVRAFKTPRGKLVGTASIMYMNPDTDGLRVSGFKILTEGKFSTGFTDEDGNIIWVAPPAYHDPVVGKYNPMFFLAKPLWQALEAKILSSFSAQKHRAR
ncbi:MAG: hypothetical protein M1459_00430 [Patescibacteria group bacterium]|nr:hypothetical protein [Patescibacteria group bacterium]